VHPSPRPLSSRGGKTIRTTTSEAERREKLEDVRRYFESRESRWGYTLLLRGRKHFGYYPARSGRLSIAKAQELMEEQLAARLGAEPGARVLDAGSGEGVVAAYLAGRYGWRIVGIDLLERNAAIAVRNARRAGVADRVEVFTGSYLDIGLPANSVDGAYTMETLVHSPDSAATLAGLYRVLKPGGRLVCAEYTIAAREDMDDRMRRILDEIVTRGAVPSLPGFVNGCFAAHFREAGFVDVQVDDLTENMLPMLRLFSRLGRAPYWLARRLGLTAHLVNAQVGVEWYRYRRHFRYVMATATKPSGTDAVDAEGGERH
jgi:ubiquinone/menaquinone biosynthesis C-methylase UbiE